MLIGEVAKRSGVSARMLRHYEALGLLTPSQRTPSGYREYSDADIGRIFHIEGLRKFGMSLSDVGQVLADPDFDPGSLLSDLIDRTRERIAAEERLLDHLEGVARLGRPDAESLLHTIDLMRSLESGDVNQRHTAALGSGVDGRVPVETLAEAVLHEPVLNAAGAMRWALAQAGSEAVPELVKGMEDDSGQVRGNALRALDEIRKTTPAEELGTRAHTLLVQALRAGLDDTAADVHGIAALVLGQMRDVTAVPALIDMAMNGPKDIEAAEALASFIAGSARPEGATTPAASRAANKPETTGRATPEPSISERETTAIGDQIITELRRQAETGDTTQRFRVLQVLLEIPGPQADDFIAELAGDEAKELAATARTALDRRRRTSPIAQHRDEPEPHSSGKPGADDARPT